MIIKNVKLLKPRYFLIFLLIFLCGCSLIVNYDNIRVREVIDGDTIVLANGQKVRYIGLDTPEIRKYILDTWVYQPQPFAEQAKEFNKNLVEGKFVRLEFDLEKKDQYNRLLAYCFIDNTFVNTRLLEEGLAALYTRPPNIKYVDLFVAAQKKARQNNKGIWQADLIIKAEDAKGFIGALKVVEGKVTGIYENSRLFKINLSSNRKKDLNIVIFKDDLPFFISQRISIKNDYRNKTIRVSGLIKEYKGEPEIIVHHPEQIEILD